MTADPQAESRVAAQGLRCAFHGLIRGFGLLDPTHTPCGQPVSVSHAHALMEILSRPGMVQGDLAPLLGLSKSAVSRVAAQLDQRGWVERQVDEADARVRRLTLTEAGRRLAERVDQASVQRFAAMLEGIPPDLRAQAIATLETLRRALPAAGNGGAP